MRQDLTMMELKKRMRCIMDTNKNSDFTTAQISEDLVDKLRELEQVMRRTTNRDIVLVAYEPETTKH
jgi:hypothetical protein